MNINVWMDCNNSNCEDEWTEIQNRFTKEGMDFNMLKSDEMVVNIWRWLVDAEINLKNSRRMFDKLREQQQEEIEEMENYVTQITDEANKTRAEFEEDHFSTKHDIETIFSIVSSIDMPGNSLIEKVEYLVSEYSKTSSQDSQETEELELSKFNKDRLISEIIKTTSEKNALQREYSEMLERNNLLQKSYKELELDNENLVSKLFEAYAELEEKEKHLGEIIFDNENVEGNHTYKLEKEDVSLKNDASQTMGTESSPASLLTSDVTQYNSLPKFRNLMITCLEIAKKEENAKLQMDCEKLKFDITKAEEKYNNLSLKYVQLKAKKKFQLEDMRGRIEALQCHVMALQSQLSSQRERLRAEEIFRKQVEADRRKVQEEKRDIIARLMSTEAEHKNCVREMAVFQKKISLLDSDNSELLNKFLRLKYKDQSIPKNFCECVLNIGSV